MKKTIVLCFCFTLLGAIRLCSQQNTGIGVDHDLVLTELNRFAQKINLDSSQEIFESLVKRNLIKELEQIVDKVLGVPIAHLKNIDKKVAEQLKSALPDAYQNFLTALVFLENPDMTADLFASTTMILDEKSRNPATKVLEDLSKLIASIARSNAPVEKNAREALKKILKAIVCKKMTEQQGCTDPGLIFNLYNLSDDVDAQGKDIGIEKLTQFDLGAAMQDLQNTIKAEKPAIEALVKKYATSKNPSGTDLRLLLTQAKNLTTDQIQTIDTLEKDQLGALATAN